MKMVKGELKILGEVFRDKDTYGQKTVR
jgi:hypothetical protein